MKVGVKLGRTTRVPRRKLTGAWTPPIDGAAFKVQEARYFLGRMVDTVDRGDEFRFNLSAFLSAARSVLYILRRVERSKEFRAWLKQTENEDEMLMLASIRDPNVHLEPVRAAAAVDIEVSGTVDMSGGLTMKLTREDGTQEHLVTPDSISEPSQPIIDTKVEWRWHFDDAGDLNVLTICQEHLQRLARLLEEVTDRPWDK